MPTDHLPMRHAMLFELLRQQKASEETATRLQAGAFDLSSVDEDQLQRRAFASLRPQTLATAIQDIQHMNARAPKIRTRWGPLPG